MDSDPDSIHNNNEKCDDNEGLLHEFYSVDQKKYNLADICRICMINDAQLINLWSPPNEKFDEEFLHIKDVLTSFSSVMIDENENLPHVICEKCEANIYFTYTFKRKCENSEEILRNTIKLKEMDEIHIENIVQVCDEPATEQFIDLENTINSTEIAYPCDQCSEIFMQRIQLNQHIKTIHKRYKCDECGEYFAQPQILKRHSKIHLGIKNKPCPICGRCFLRSDDLKRHIRVHTGEKPFNCDQCSKSYKQSSELTQHKLTHSGVKQFTCKLCNKSMSTRNGYYIHMKVHNGQKNHHCHLCDKKFVTNSERNSHVQYIHLKEKLFKCTVPDCSKRFVTKISLNKHLKIHARKINKFDTLFNSNEQVGPRTITEYECSICAKQLLSSQALKNHMKLHETTNNVGLFQMEKRYECEICEKKFVLNSTFLKHMACHTPFMCAVCGASHIHYESFMLHRELHDNDEEDDDDESTVLMK